MEADAPADAPLSVPPGSEPTPLEMLRIFEATLKEGLTANPLESLVALVGIGSAFFYWAEVGRNEKVRDYWDAFHYVATSLSVGYANIFPETPLGKAIGGLVMIVGPSLTSKVMDEALTGDEPDQGALVAAKLDEILVELRRMGAER